MYRLYVLITLFLLFGYSFWFMYTLDHDDAYRLGYSLSLFDLPVLVPTVGILGLCLVHLRKRSSKSAAYLFCFTTFYVYMMGVAHYSLFPITVDPNLGEIDISSSINLNPIKIESWQYLISGQVLLNILMTTPFGLGISYVKELNTRQVLMWGFLFCFLIEFIQLVLLWSLQDTTFKIDIIDLICNFAGVCVGYGIFWTISHLEVHRELYNQIHMDRRYASISNQEQMKS
ncbi:VanZ family protein [Thermoactinomyces sp. DSM 45892]|uniref:VanZ family protein n=1 Tax=Thermoactinomyces sp. DSM 45892 TaxID=1882753 RepID=UPI00089D4A3E|nr:VanZ family protein [Thermoactinomyces sp. DSM 45892]SDY85374.1 Glycopeptide antibiotics resistance protein [Thermoactinomyces sp. DSM 45892]